MSNFPEDTYMVSSFCIHPRAAMTLMNINTYPDSWDGPNINFLVILINLQIRELLYFACSYKKSSDVQEYV